MDRSDLLHQVLQAPAFKTRQQLWHRCIEEIKLGDVCLEFGVWRGGSINYFAHARPDNEFHGFDSFDGLPQDWIRGRPRGHFKTERGCLKFAPNVIIHEGLFCDTIPKLESCVREKVKFIHIDCDLGTSTSEVLWGMERAIRLNNCLLLFDEFYNYGGYEDHEFKSFLNFINRTGSCFLVEGRNINHQQVLIQML